MSLTKDDLGAIRGVTQELIEASEKRLEKKFEAIDKKLVVAEKNFGAINKKLEAIDRHFEDLTLQIGQGFNEATERFGGIQMRVEALEDKADGLQGALGDLQEIAGNIDARTKNIERIVANETERVDKQALVIGRLRKALQAE